MPNTCTMQEIIRTAVDNYFDDIDNGVSIEPPFVFSIRKGMNVFLNSNKYLHSTKGLQCLRALCY